MKKIRNFINGLFFFFLCLFTLNVGRSTWVVGEGQAGEDTYIVKDLDDATPIKAGSAAAVAYYDSTYFPSIEGAIKSAGTATKTIYVIPGTNPTIKGNKNNLGNYELTIPSNITLNFPYGSANSKDTFKKYPEDGTESKNDPGFADSVYSTSSVTKDKTNGGNDLDGDKYLANRVFVNDNVKIINNGELNIGGKVGGTTPQSATSGSHVELFLGSGSQIVNNGTINCYGFIKKQSTASVAPSITCNRGSTLLEPLTVYDYEGGGPTYMQSQQGAFPFKEYNLPNVQTKIIFMSGSNFKGYVYFWGTNARFDTTAMIIGNCSADGNVINDALILLYPNTYCEWSFVPNSLINTNNSWGAHSTSVDLYGKAKISNLSVKVEILFVSETINSRDFYMPIGNEYTFNIKQNSNFYVENRVAFFPGSTINIESNAIAYINANVVIFPNKNGLRPGYGSNEPAKICVDGTVNINSPVGGHILYGSSNTGVLNIAEGINTSGPTDCFDASGGKFNLINNVDATKLGPFVFPLTADLYDSSVTNSSKRSKQNLTSNSIYYSDGASSNLRHWDGPGGTYSLSFLDKYSDNFEISKVTHPQISNFKDTINLTPSKYDGDEFIFNGYSFDAEGVDKFSSNSDVNCKAHLSSIVSNSHTLLIYVHWVSSNSPKANYYIGSYNENSLPDDPVVYGELNQIEIGKTINLEAMPSRKTYYNNSSKKIYLFTFSKWQYSINDSNFSDLNGTVFSNFNEGDVIKFKPIFTYEDLNYPKISVDNVTLGKKIGEGSLSAKISENYDERFTYIGYFSTTDSNITIKTKTPNLNVSNKTFTTSFTETSGGNHEDNSTSTAHFSFKLNFYLTSEGNTSQGEVTSKNNAITYHNNCLMGDTLITMPDGSYKQIKDVKQGELIKVFNHETGEFDIAPVTFNEKEEANYYNVIHLNFEDGTDIGVISEHGFFDLNTMRYEYIREDNYHSFIGHCFVNERGERVKLTNAFVKKEYTETYSLPSYFHLNCYTNGFLSMPGGITGLFNIFEYDENLQYNQEKYQNDIDTYGLMTLEELIPYGVNEEMYNAYPAKYLKVALGKGIMTEEQLKYLIDRYGKYTE